MTPDELEDAYEEISTTLCTFWRVDGQVEHRLQHEKEKDLLDELCRLARLGAAVEAKRYLSYAIVGHSLIVTHPAIIPHEIVCIRGDWYCYPISPELDKLKAVEFTHGDWKADLRSEQR